MLSTVTTLLSVDFQTISSVKSIGVIVAFNVNDFPLYKVIKDSSKIIEFAETGLLINFMLFSFAYVSANVPETPKIVNLSG